MIAFYGVRGIGSLYYLAYAATHVEFINEGALWALVAFTIFASTVIHGLTAREVVRLLERDGYFAWWSTTSAAPVGHSRRGDRRPAQCPWHLTRRGGRWHNPLGLRDVAVPGDVAGRGGCERARRAAGRAGDAARRLRSRAQGLVEAEPQARAGVHRRVDRAELHAAADVRVFPIFGQTTEPRWKAAKSAGGRHSAGNQPEVRKAPDSRARKVIGAWTKCPPERSKLCPSSTTRPVSLERKCSPKSRRIRHRRNRKFRQPRTDRIDTRRPCQCCR